MVGIVVVSHSATLAEGVAELARGMAGEDVAIETAGGLEPPEEALGTDATRVAAAIERADSGAGVVVLMDLGSAVLSAELALDLIDQTLRERVLLTAAPLVEGAVAAVVTARAGGSPADVAREAEAGLGAKTAQLEPAGSQSEAPAASEGGEEGVTATLPVTNPLGLHARPAARFVATASAFEAQVRVTNATTGRGPADARSLSAVAGLGVRQGHELLVTAAGPQADAVLQALAGLASRGFDDDDAVAPPPASAVPTGQAEAGVLAGLPAAGGVAVGPLRRLRLPEVTIPDDGAADGEERRLEEARAEVATALARTRAAVVARAGEGEAAIFDAHRLLLDDPELVGEARRAIAEDGRNAAAAFARVTERAAAAWRELDDEYLRARAADVEAVGDQVVRALLGVEATPELAGEGIVVARDLTPAQTAALDPGLVLGIATATGAPTSHSAILARSLGIPAVVALGDGLLELDEGTTAVLDGDAGTLRPDPEPAELQAASERAEQQRKRADAARERAAEPARTSDGVTVEVVANVGSLADAHAAAAAGADGVGLLRSEFVFLGRSTLPDEEEQVTAYREIAAALGGRPVVLRTLDVGADKPLPFLRQPPEENPFLGRRGLRLGLALPDVLRAQLRAVLRVAAELPLAVMFPMVSTLDELRRAREILGEAEAELRDRGEPLPDGLRVGMMVEVPAAALTATAFASEVDFFSLGTNDLTQYVLAAERGNEHVAGLADGLHPAVLRLVGEVAAAGEQGGAAVHVCGELAGDPDAVPLLLGLGVHELSVAPPLVPAVKERVRATSREEARVLAARALELATAAEVRALVRDELSVAGQV